MMKYLSFLAAGCLLFGCNSSRAPESRNYRSENLVIEKIGEHAYRHTTFFNSESFGRVPCNGVIFFDEGEAVVFDTPPDDSTSEALISWVQHQLHCTIKAVVPTHFHRDCLGGLAAFHKHNIPSYANNATIKLAEARHWPVPRQGFDSLLELKAGKEKIIAAFIGAGHTKDNIIGYLPGEKIMFGGCLIKEVGAGKGNLEDADTSAWAPTVVKLKEQYPDVKIVVPGHGKTGGAELLDFTMKLFE